MSSRSSRRPASRQRRSGRSATARARPVRRRRVPWIVGVVVIVIAIALVFALAGGSNKTSPVRSPAPPALVATISSLPKSLFDTVGTGTITALPKKITAPALTAAGTPLVLYIGAEYCPFCAAERWAMVVALSRFGTFSGLEVTHSASNDVFPNTQTFSFHGSTYKSKYLRFEAVELKTNQIGANGNYQTLDTPTAEQQQIFATYDAPPFTTTAGSIPFIDFGGKYIVNGATYDPAVLQGKSASDIATALAQPDNAVAKGVIGAANTLTAAICALTKNQPAAVCADPVISSIRTKLG
jgi:hypothetical protein